MAKRIERVLTNDPGIGVARHVDAGYDEAKSFAKEKGIKVPMAEHTSRAALRSAALVSWSAKGHPGQDGFGHRVEGMLRCLRTKRLSVGPRYPQHKLGPRSHISGNTSHSRGATADSARVRRAAPARAVARRCANLASSRTGQCSSPMARSSLWVRPTKSRRHELLASKSAHVDEMDCSGKVVLPGFVDSHTHPVFTTPRLIDFEKRIAGASYEEIAEAGGGIRASLRGVRDASQVDARLSCLTGA